MNWKPILAALGNEAARTVFARAALGQLDADARAGLTSREAKALQTWLSLGGPLRGSRRRLPHHGRFGHRGRLPPARRSHRARGEQGGAQKARAGVGRFLVGGLGPRIQALPATPAERRELLLWVRDAALRPGEVLTEPQLNERLRVFHEDVALVRRYLVDPGLLERTPTGTEYALPAD